MKQFLRALLPVPAWFNNQQRYCVSTEVVLGVCGSAQPEVCPPTLTGPSNEIFGECNWTPGMSVSDHMLVLCQKLHI